MRVLHMPNYYYPHIGGIEVTARDLVNALKSQGITEQKVICMNEGSKSTVHDVVEDIDVVRCASPVKFFSQSLSTDYARELKVLFEDFKPDTIVLHWPNPFTAFNLLRYKNRRFRFVLYWHSDIIKQKTLGRMLNSIAVKLAERADVIIATSPNYIEGSDILKSNREKCVVIPSCIDPDRFIITDEIRSRANEIRKQHQNKTICFAFGRHVPYKGFEYLEEAKKHLPEDIEVIIGEKLSQEDLIANLAACDIFCFPSITKNEAFGLGLAEGMLFGHPAVTFNIPGSGVNYVSLDGVTGIECPNRDAKAYADAIIKLAGDKKLRERLGAQARERVLENFIYEKYSVHINNFTDRWRTEAFV